MKPELKRYSAVVGTRTFTFQTGTLAAQAGGAVDDLEAAVIGVAAEIFRVDPALIDADSRPGSVPGWDSFSQLNFLMASEDRFGVTIPASLVAQIVSVADMVKAIRQLRT